MLRRHPYPCTIALCALLPLAAASLRAQTPAATGAPAAQVVPPDYDVSTVKSNNTGSHSIRVSIDDGLLRADNAQVKMLMEMAFDIRQDQILNLPHWAEVNHYDITAKVVEMTKEQQKALNKEQRQAMMQKLLKERFHLEAHVEERTLPILELVVAKEGIKFQEFHKPAEDETPAEPGKPDPKRGGFMNMSNNSLSATGLPMDSLAKALSSMTHMPVTDKTGLTGLYSFTVKYQREEEGPQSGLRDDSLPTIYTALQEQLGLRLEKSKGPVKVLVVDRIEQPEEN